MSSAHRFIFGILMLILLSVSLQAQELIYTEDFSASAPQGWSRINNGAEAWTFSETFNPYSGSHCMRYQGNYWDPADAWAFTQGVEMIAGNSYFVEFYQSVYSSYYHESMRLTVGTAPSIAAQSITLLNLPDLVNAAYINRVSNTFTPTVSGTYFFGFHCYSAAQMYRLNVDLVRIYEIDNSGVANPGNLRASSGNPDRIDLAWNPNENADEVMIAFAMTDVFGSPVAGTIYDPMVNNSINGGGTVIYKGSANRFAHTGLSGNTRYYYKAWSVSNAEYSSGIGTSALTPAIASIAQNYSQDFDTYGMLPQAWSQTSGGSAQWEFVSSDADHGASAPQSGSHFARLNCYNIQVYNNPTCLISPPLDLREGNKKISFWSWIGSSAFTTQPIRVEISTDNQANWDILTGLDNHNNAWNFTVLDLTGFTEAGSAYIRFAGYSNWGVNFCNLGLDSFEFFEDVSALEVPIVNISHENGIIHLWWENISGASSYRIECADAPGEPFIFLGNSNINSFTEACDIRKFYRVFALSD